ncbi:MAG: transglycosylase SLT domain-containing protein [Candidatus Micrarchaeota archaeon]|nr:transglycosylase SLT domain-containing protein [Candidatus Micrarchaeota archaeon]
MQRQRGRGGASLKSMATCGVGVCSAVVALSIFPGSLAQYRIEPQPSVQKTAELSVKVDKDSDAFYAGLYMKGGKWDIAELRKKQDEYFEFIRDNRRTGKFYSYPNAIESFMPIINGASRKYGVNPRIIASIIQAESFGYTYAIGSDGEMGLMQPDPNKHPKEMMANYSRIFDPRVNIDLGTSLFKDYLVEFHGNSRKALEAYNAGENSVIRNRLPKSTREYVSNVLRRCSFSIRIRR